VDIVRIETIFHQLMEEQRKEEALQQKSIKAVVSADRRFVTIQIKDEQQQVMVLEETVELSWNNLTLVEDPMTRRSTYRRPPNIFAGGALVPPTPSRYASSIYIAATPRGQTQATPRGGFMSGAKPNRLEINTEDLDDDPAEHMAYLLGHHRALISP